MRRALKWLLPALLAVAITVLAFLPAAWMAGPLEQQTGGRLTLGDAQGSIWRGSAFIGGAASSSDLVTPLLPGRFSWRLSPLALIGMVDLELENAAALTPPVAIKGSWNEWRVSGASVVLPAERLAALGAPLNTLAPSGQMRLSWNELSVARRGNAVDLTGAMTLDLNDIASRLSPIRPLGAYQIEMLWQGQQAQLALKTVRGPLLLSGTGSLTGGRLQFSGIAEAQKGKEDALANLLNLLGQRRKVGDKNVIALEFR